MAKKEEVQAAPGQTVVIKQKSSLLTKILGFGCLGIVAIVVIAVAVSSGSDDQPTETFETASTPAATQKAEYAVNEEIEQDNVVLTVTDVQRNYSSGNEFIRPEAGNEYIRVNVKIVNNSNTPRSYNPFDFKVQNSTGNRKDNTYIGEVPNELSYGELASGGSVVGNLIFEVPNGDSNLKLIYNSSFWGNEVVVKL